jgi:hypothetical protein
MKTNDIKKDQKFLLKGIITNTCIMADNRKGNIRNARVPNLFNGELTLGSVYAHDITHGEVDGEWVPVELTKSQQKCGNMNAALWGE